MLTFLFYRLFQYADLPKRSLIKFMRIFLNYFHMGKFILTENFCQVRTVKKLPLFNNFFLGGSLVETEFLRQVYPVHKNVNRRKNAKNSDAQIGHLSFGFAMYFEISMYQSSTAPVTSPLIT